MKKTSPVSDACLMDAFVHAPRGRFPATMQRGLGMSFSHSGLTHQQVMERFKLIDDKRDESNPVHVVRQVDLEDSENGLQVTLEYTIYPAHQAVVYGAMLRNAGRRNIEHLRLLNSYDLTFAPLQNIGDPRVHTIGGGLTHFFYPPLAYRLQEWRLLGPTELTIDSGPSGRSSDKDLPFFIIEDGNRSSGIFGGIEWSGLWHITFTRRDEPQPSHYGRLGPDKSVTIQGGMDGVDLVLKTGETFYMPRVLVGFYEGSLQDGRNRLRRFISNWGPSLAGEGGIPLFVQSSPDGCYSKYQVNAEVCRANASAMATVGADCYLLGNWFMDKKAREKTYSATSATRGSWIPDPVRWPNQSLKDFSEHVKSLGMRLGLWTDIEVASSESIVATEYPDWVLYLENGSDGLLNFALPEVQDWAIETYDRLIREYGVTWFYLDNNIDGPAPYWDAYEPKHDRGRLQHNFIRGIWRVWEWILRNHPDVGLENCSSGGRRIDLGMLRRTHRSQSSDQFRHPDSIRYQSSGFNTVIPGDRMSTFTCCGLSPYPDVAFHANFGGMLALSEDFEHWSPEELARAQKHVQVYRTIRHLLGKDFYPLFPQPQSLGEWDGWQYHDPVADEGFVLVFRAQSPQESASPRLRGLSTEGDYVLTNPYTGEKKSVAGSTLLISGLPVSLPLEGTRLLCYRPGKLNNRT